MKISGYATYYCTLMVNGPSKTQASSVFLHLVPYPENILSIMNVSIAQINKINIITDTSYSGLGDKGSLTISFE